MKFQFLKRCDSTIFLLEIQQVCLLRLPQIPTDTTYLRVCLKIIPKMTLQVPHWSFLAEPYDSSMFPKKLFPCTPFSTGKSQCICPGGQKWHQQLSQTNNHKPFSAAPRNEAQANTWRPNFKGNFTSSSVLTDLILQAVVIMSST